MLNLRGLERHADNGYLLARIVGEEFIAIVTGVGNSDIDVEAIAIRIWHDIRSSSMTDFHKCGRQTASIGIAKFCLGEEFRDVYPRADKAMYSAKNSGRDAIVRADNCRTKGADDTEKFFEIARPKICRTA